MMFTLGTGDFMPNGGFGEIATSLAGLSGLFMLTLAVTFLLAIIQAVVAKRTFASLVWSLGRQAEELILVFAHGVDRSVRPAPAAIFSAQRNVEEFLDTLRTAFVEPSDAPTPPPNLANYASAGIPVVPTKEFEEAIAKRAERRDLLRGFLDSERRDWP